MYIRIFDICIRGYGAIVCVSVVERGLLVRVPSPRGGLLGGRRWSSRERTVASRRSDRKRGVAVQHVTNVLFLGRERTPYRTTHLRNFFPPDLPSLEILVVFHSKANVRRWLHLVILIGR